MDICIIPCGKKKIWDVEPQTGAVKASEAYIGTLHRKCQAYADLFTDSYRILSARHGFLHPDDLLFTNYDETFGSRSMSVASESLSHQFSQLPSEKRIILLTGKKYEEKLKPLLQRETVLRPLSGARGIGDILHLLQEAVDARIPLHRERWETDAG
ncbi:DUF6884 domain-containing protein [Alkalicoccus luteus]|uniref:DUF6884 domain-containing protein n=1 Tax=Alkalicoccus luteus TaxID=1237094 RepID=UPI0040344E37